MVAPLHIISEQVKTMSEWLELKYPSPGHRAEARSVTAADILSRQRASTVRWKIRLVRTVGSMGVPGLTNYNVHVTNVVMANTTHSRHEKTRDMSRLPVLSNECLYSARCFPSLAGLKVGCTEFSELYPHAIPPLFS